MKNVLLLLTFFILPFLSFAQHGFGAGGFYDDYSFLPPNSDYTEMVDTGNYKIWDSTFIGSSWNRSGFYGRKENDSLYFGFTMSNIEFDSITVLNHHKAAVCGIGADSSRNYGVAHGTNYGADIDYYIGVRGNMPATVFYLFVTNAAITAKSMMYGDSTSKKFGGVDGTDPDWLKLMIYQYAYGNLIDSTEVYLADFRSTDSAEDFILEDWKFVTLNSGMQADSMSFALSSSDTDSLGNMRTPNYFCIDNLSIDGGGAIENVKNKISANIFPNPTNSIVNIETDIQVNALLYDVNGKLLLEKENCKRMDVSGFPAGTYLLKIRDRKSEAESNYMIRRE